MIRSSHGSKVLRRLLIGALALLIPVLAGCEAGDDAPTLKFHPAANGAYGTADAVTVDNAFVLGGRNNTLLASGSSASMFLYLYKHSGSADKLISVSAPGTATSVQITGGFMAGDKAVVLITGEGAAGKVTGEALMIKEAGTWRVDDEITALE